VALDKEICRRCIKERRMSGGRTFNDADIAVMLFETRWQQGVVWCQVVDDWQNLFQIYAEKPPPGCLFAAEQAVSQW